MNLEFINSNEKLQYPKLKVMQRIAWCEFKAKNCNGAYGTDLWKGVIENANIRTWLENIPEQDTGLAGTLHGTTSSRLHNTFTKREKPCI